MNFLKSTELDRTKFILSYANIFALCFSALYSILLIWGYVNEAVRHTGNSIFSINLAVIIPVLFLISYYLNLRGNTSISKLILISTIFTINFIAGIWWGFDLPSVLLSYVFCIVILALTSKTHENIIYTVILVLSIIIGDFTRQNLKYTLTWYGSHFGINDIIEFSIMFIFISFILVRFNREQNKTLSRALRVENTLIAERANLEMTIEQKTKEIKHLQQEELSKIYHLVEFGKLSSGLYHDLITPIQTMNLYIEKLTEEHLIDDSRFSKVIMNIKNTHDKLTLMLQNIRKQISLNVQDEEFNLVTEVKDLVDLVKNNYFKNDVHLILNFESSYNHVLYSKKSIINHIVLNLVSNAYEACLQDKNINNKSSYTINISLGRHNDKNYISVTDNGTGISGDNLKTIFDNFYSTKSSQPGKYNCGIGLSSAKYYTEKHLNGKMYVESEYGEGTTMSILF